jgi:hypothetical protein
MTHSAGHAAIFRGHIGRCKIDRRAEIAMTPELVLLAVGLMLSMAAIFSAATYFLLDYLVGQNPKTVTASVPSNWFRDMAA